MRVSPVCSRTPVRWRALSVYLDGEPVVDVWTGWSDRRGRRRWSADTAPMVFSATKGVASTVIHRLADRGLIDYDARSPSTGRSSVPTAGRDHRSRCDAPPRRTVAPARGAKRELLDHHHMEEPDRRRAGRPAFRKSAYHALTYGWLLSGLARSVTGRGCGS